MAYMQSFRHISLLSPAVEGYEPKIGLASFSSDLMPSCILMRWYFLYNPALYKYSTYLQDLVASLELQDDVHGSKKNISFASRSEFRT